ncbi:MAG TPA: hypothetical protein VFW33_13725, partial [Gemmataceae bacterium]|nr:hypothetical protein [Gemmataceae bacterium]
ADLEQHGMPVEAALPALLLLRNEQILPRLRRALASSNTGRYVGALRGVLYWVEGHHLPRKGKAHPRLPPVPYDLLHEVGMIVAGRRQPGLLPALEVTEAVLDHSPEAADERFRLSVVVGLEYLLTEAAYRAAEDPDPRVPYDDVPECRRRAARIASLFRSLFDDDSAVVAQWIDAGRGDPLPEVRQAVEDPAAGAEG